MPVPEKFENKPTLPDHLQFTWRAYWALSSDRHIGMAEGPIPWSAMDRYAIRYGIVNMDDFDFFTLLLKAMDTVYLEIRAKQMNKKAKGKIGTKSFDKPSDGESKEVLGMK